MTMYLTIIVEVWCPRLRKWRLDPRHMQVHTGDNQDWCFCTYFPAGSILFDQLVKALGWHWDRHRSEGPWHGICTVDQVMEEVGFKRSSQQGVVLEPPGSPAWTKSLFHKQTYEDEGLVKLCEYLMSLEQYGPAAWRIGSTPSELRTSVLRSMRDDAKCSARHKVREWLTELEVRGGAALFVEESKPGLRCDAADFVPGAPTHECLGAPAQELRESLIGCSVAVVGADGLIDKEGIVEECSGLLKEWGSEAPARLRVRFAQDDVQWVDVPERPKFSSSRRSSRSRDDLPAVENSRVLLRGGPWRRPIEGHHPSPCAAPSDLEFTDRFIKWDEDFPYSYIGMTKNSLTEIASAATARARGRLAAVSKARTLPVVGELKLVMSLILQGAAVAPQPCEVRIRLCVESFNVRELFRGLAGEQLCAGARLGRDF